ncbi:site-specific DNA-methyltransferase [Sediminibacterium sp.]|jgi:adenine-specific DNA-methyltransferase|uniref:site-specific DNA-methyltransferase n=1 Tax=Sediminibacterium sp. TaxID=1917865 RepID=UPI00273302CA|nr:site-specific DNA-methyltransferase [Sediminibacterium sp.]MDP1818245.1 site-specific DNA-methyltransferase [Leadbetterella sp.]MDP3393528.1 site-specific DNA-methyltransferase [Sediminibacterium sp.]MDP3566701.1 site-specific DNA-methyltransferase [Sediminibacterium sp.]
MPTLQFKGKTFVQNHHLAVKYHQLVPKKKLSLTDKISLHDNLIIQGDNLKALKALLPTYAGKANCIFIDPPYNTGNDIAEGKSWVYNDNVNSPMIKEWLGKEVLLEDLTRHDKWLCMMMPRLKLLRELLHDDGVIFVTLDDIEVHRCKLLMDEIFGEINFVTNIPWQARKSVQNDTDISSSHNHILVYAKNRRQEERRLKKSNSKRWHTMPGFVFQPMELDKTKFSNPDNDPRGLWKADPFDAPGVRKNLEYEIINPNTNEVYTPPKGRHWGTEETKYLDYLKDNRILFGKTGKSGPQLKVFWDEKKEYGEVETTWWGEGAMEGFLEDGIDEETASEFTNYGTTTKGSQLLQIIFGGEKVFNNPKPIELIKHILKIAAKKDSLILDSFAGSGTTGHAVLELNKEDGGNRKFILVEMEEYANTITAERIRRVIKGVENAKNGNLKAGVGGTFSYFELGPTIEMESILQGKNLPSYEEFARYIFYTATGEEFNEKKINEKTGFIGDTKNYELYMFYKPDVEWLKRNALTLDGVKGMPKFKGKQRLVFAPAKYVDDETCRDNRIDFCQLPYEIYRIQK